jgi:tetratricopeptide (TPR) repeat protein
VFRAWPDDVKRHPRSIQSFASTCAASGLVKQARWLYEQFYNLNPMHPRSGAMLILAGDTYLQQGRPDRAALFYQHVLAQHANTEASDRAYLRLAQLGGASIRQDPERSLSAQVRGLMDVTSGLIMDESSQETIYRAVAIDRADTALGSEAQYLLGQHHERAGNLTDAVAVYRSLRERRGVVDGDAWPSAAAQRLRAILSPWVAAALARRDDLTAIKLYRSAGEDPEHIYDDVALLVGVADAYQRLGLSGEAVKLFQVALRAPDHERVLSPALLGLGRAYMDQADIPAARQVFQRFRLQFPLAPERGEALTALIALAERDQDRKTVIRLSKIWLRDFPNEPARASVMLSLAEALVRDGGIDDALRVYAQAEQVRPTVSAGNWLHHADVLISGGRPAEAVRRYQLALLSRPTAEEDAWARVRMASALRQLNRRADAAAVLAPIRVKKADELVGRYSNMLERDLDLGGGG